MMMTGIQKLSAKYVARSCANAESFLLQLEHGDTAANRRFPPRFTVTGDDEGNLVEVKFQNGSNEPYIVTPVGCAECRGSEWYVEQYQQLLEDGVPLSDFAQVMWTTMAGECKHWKGFQLAVAGRVAIAKATAVVLSWGDQPEDPDPKAIWQSKRIFNAAYETEMKALWSKLAKHRAKEAKREAQAARQKAAIQKAEKQETAARVERMIEDYRVASGSATVGNLVRKLLNRPIHVG
jgi:hypothetical protein